MTKSFSTECLGHEMTSDFGAYIDFLANFDGLFM